MVGVVGVGRAAACHASQYEPSLSLYLLPEQQQGDQLSLSVENFQELVIHTHTHTGTHR